MHALLSPWPKQILADGPKLVEAGSGGAEMWLFASLLRGGRGPRHNSQDTTSLGGDVCLPAWPKVERKRRRWPARHAVPGFPL